MDKFLKKLNFGFQGTQIVLKKIGFIDAFKGKWNIVEKRENIYLKELRKIATIESIGSSTRIEGAELTNDEIRELLNNLEITKLKTRDEQEVIGYYDVLELVYENFEGIDLSANHLLNLHQRLLKYSTKDDRHRGNYKNLSNKVVANYPDGSKKVIFSTTDPHLVEIEMNELIDWTNQQLAADFLHPLIIIGLFIYEFLSIHPFQDGNGRLSRLLTNLLLLKYDYQFIKYVSFENLIEQQKKAYYEALMEGQKNRNTEAELVEKWVIFFLESLENLVKRLEQKYDVYKNKGGYLNDRQKEIKEIIKQNKSVKLADLSKAMPHISINTLKKDLIYLKTEKVIESIGQQKGTVYVVAQS
jgi:Fic family protein